MTINSQVLCMIPLHFPLLTKLFYSNTSIESPEQISFAQFIILPDYILGQFIN